MCKKMKLNDKNIIVWGTGKLFEEYKEYLLEFHIIKFCDSDLKKQGDYINGIEIISPDEIKKYEYSYIVIMVYSSIDIYKRLADMQVPACKVLLHNQICSLKEQTFFIQSGERQLSFEEWKKKSNKPILLLSHNFDYSGVPVALKNMAIVLKRMGYSVLMAAMKKKGNFITELEVSGVDYYLDDVAICYGATDFKKILSQFSVIVIGTFVLYRVVMAWEKVNVPILWWIHETYEVLYEGKDILPQNKNVSYLAGGNRVRKVFKAHYPDKHIKKLQYCIPDTGWEQNEKQKLPIVVAAIGTINQRKAQDVLLEVINMLPNNYQHKFKFVLIGKILDKDKNFEDLIRGEITKISQLEWIEELTQEELDLYYESIDVLVCASRDDPMPVVVAQAMMHRKVCIVSDEVGQVEFIVPKENGLIFKSEDRQSLKEALIWIADHRERLKIIGKNARKIYDSEFSEEVMKGNLSKILGDVLYKEN